MATDLFADGIFDIRTPILVVKIGRYPLHHGGVGAIRSLGRVGVPVYAVTEDRRTPAALSHHLRGRFVWPTTGSEPPERLLDGLTRIAGRLADRGGRAAVALPTDDEAAILLAEHAPRLEGLLTVPAVPAGLPRALAGKQTLHELCTRHGVPTPGSRLPRTRDELELAAKELTFPLVAKNADAFHRLSLPAVGSSTVLQDPAALERLAAHWTGELPRVLLQEYIPAADSEDWICHLYCGSEPDGSADLVCTGVKVRAWPARGGVTAYAYSTANPGLAELSSRLCRAVGYRGACDLDWRLDRRDGRYKLLDFNPRVGAQFRLFQTDRGIDLARALHLDLTGRRGRLGAAGYGTPVSGRAFTVETLDLPARAAARAGRRSAELPAEPQWAPPSRPSARELAWTALDDPLPALAAAIRSVPPAVHVLRRALRSARRRGRAA